MYLKNKQKFTKLCMRNKFVVDCANTCHKNSINLIPRGVFSFVSLHQLKCKTVGTGLNLQEKMCPNHWTSLNKNIKIIINNHSLDMPSHALRQIGFTQPIRLLLITRISDCIIKKIIF